MSSKAQSSTVFITIFGRILNLRHSSGLVLIPPSSRNERHYIDNSMLYYWVVGLLYISFPNIFQYIFTEKK